MRGRTDAEGTHGGALGVHLIDVGETTSEGIWCDLVAILVPELSGLRACAIHL